MNSIKDDKVRIGQIGVGYWGPNLLRNLVGNKNCALTKVADLSKDRRDFVSQQFPHISVCEDPEDLISDPNIEAVVISTPAATHFELATRALESGKHILVEKPMATTSGEVEIIGKTAKKNGLVAMVGHTFVYNSAVRYLKGLIDEGALGTVRYIYCKRLNLGRIRSDVDALWNFAPHDISIAQYLMGDPIPSGLTYQGMDYVQEGIDDVAFLNIVYPSGVLVNIHVSWLDPHRTREIVVVGSDKMVVYDDVSDNKITIYDKGIDRYAVLGKDMDYDIHKPPSFKYRTGDILIPQIDFVEPLKVEIAHFIECIQKGTPCVTGADHALKVVQILEKAKQPIVSSKQRGVPLKDRIEVERIGQETTSSSINPSSGKAGVVKPKNQLS